MTEKELLYVEDAIEHENSIISICNNIKNNLKNNNLIKFIDNQINCHTNLKEQLFSILKENVNAR